MLFEKTSTALARVCPCLHAWAAEAVIRLQQLTSSSGLTETRSLRATDVTDV